MNHRVTSCENKILNLCWLQPMPLPPLRFRSPHHLHPLPPSPLSFLLPNLRTNISYFLLALSLRVAACLFPLLFCPPLERDWKVCARSVESQWCHTSLLVSLLPPLALAPGQITRGGFMGPSRSITCSLHDVRCSVLLVFSYEFYELLSVPPSSWLIFCVSSSSAVAK